MDLECFGGVLGGFGVLSCSLGALGCFGGVFGVFLCAFGVLVLWGAGFEVFLWGLGVFLALLPAGSAVFMLWGCN